MCALPKSVNINHLRSHRSDPHTHSNHISNIHKYAFNCLNTEYTVICCSKEIRNSYRMRMIERNDRNVPKWKIKSKNTQNQQSLMLMNCCCYYLFNFMNRARFDFQAWCISMFNRILGNSLYGKMYALNDE